VVCILLAASTSVIAAPPKTVHVWEKVEITLQADTVYKNPYTEATVWVDLRGPGFAKRCYGFWDGGQTFRVRVLATAPGKWTWRSGSTPNDTGLANITGSFTAKVWVEAEKATNSCRRGMVGPTTNGHAFQYADKTPFFLMGDTWWSIATFRYRWYDDDIQRPLGPKAGFKDYVRFRRKQEYNCLAMIAAFPNWANDGKARRLNMPDGTVLRAAWGQAGTTSAKDMTDEAGRRAFFLPGKVPGYEKIIPDLTRINPAYFQSMDRKIDHLNSQGIIPFIEVARRDIGQAWKKYYPWPDSYTLYIQYIWSRYQANICFYSPIHLDTPHLSIPTKDWNVAANAVIAKYGAPPFGTQMGTNSNPSSLKNWGHVDKAKWLRFHQVGNRRTHDLYPYLTEIFNTKPPVPAINGEPYYDGMLDEACGSVKAALYCRSAMYGSVLSGGLGGHIYGAGGWQGGLWSGEVEKASKFPIWDVIQWQSADQMRHLKRFILSEGTKYQHLVPSADLVSPGRSGKPKSCLGWAFCARTADRTLFMLYFEQDCPKATLSGTQPGGKYRARWYDTRKGRWVGNADTSWTANVLGKIDLGAFPRGDDKSKEDWALKLTLVGAP
jgi:hypothetical protein